MRTRVQSQKRLPVGTCVISMVRVEVLLSGGRRSGTPRQRQVQERSASSLGRPLRAKSSVLAGLFHRGRHAQLRRVKLP